MADNRLAYFTSQAQNLQRYRTGILGELFSKYNIESADDRATLRQFASDIYQTDSLLAGEIIVRLKAHSRKEPVRR